MNTNTKVWFVTGASKGMGLALVKLLLKQGHKVAATSRKKEELEKQIKENGENFLPLEVDITNDQEVKEALKKTVDAFGRLDVVVNNAGYAIYGAIEELSEQEFRQSVNVNLFGTINTIRHAMPYLRQQKAGHVINFSSIGGYKGYGSDAAYCAMKFAVVGLSESLYEETKHLGIKVTVVAPGFFRTAFLDKLMLAKNRIADYNTAAIENWMLQVAGKQQGDPEKLVKILVAITNMENPPVHLIAGPDAYQIRLEKAKADIEELEAWKQLTLSTDFDQ